MSAILEIFGTRGRFFLILDCGHWFKWTGDTPPDPDKDFRCPRENLPRVSAKPPAPPAETEKG